MRGRVFFLVTFFCAPTAAWSPELAAQVRRSYEPAAPSSNSNTQDDVRRIIRTFAECTVARSPGRVAEASAAYFMADLGTIASPRCLDGARLAMPQQALRGELYGVLYRRDFRKTPVDFLPEPIDYSSMGGNDQILALREVGDCAVRADPQNSHRLTFSAIGSSVENSAFQELSSVLGKCVPEGTSLTFSRSIFSAVIMEALYHLSTQRALPAPGRN